MKIKVFKRKKSEIILTLEDFIQVLGDFPVFQYWNFNKKEFEPRALNKLSINFNRYLARSIEEFQQIEFIKEDHIISWLIKEFVDAVKYAYYGNRSYEADGPNSYCGGDDSIQEQFVCWALNMPVEEYRTNGSGLAYSDEIYSSVVIKEWLLNSDFYHYLFKD